MSKYDPKFYDAIRAGCIASAQAVVPYVREALVDPVRTVVDVGGGEGWWARAFLDHGATEATCLDGGTRHEEAPGVRFIPVDLTRPFSMHDVFDLAVCLEVAEHVPAVHADRLVESLCNLAPVVLFSAAMPRQGGTGHVNCQPPAYWAEKFAAHGYICDGSLRWAIWDLPEVEPWYKSNLLLFRHAWRYDDPAHEEPLHVIHPDLWLQPR